MVTKIFILLVLLMPAGLQAEAASGVVAPGFPVPSHISDQAKAILGRPIDLRGASRIPRSKAEWRAAIKQSAERFAAQLDAVRAAPVSIERRDIAGVPVRFITPNGLSENRQSRLLINLHGGAYVQLGGELSLFEGVQFALASGYRVAAVDYRMPPDHPFPAAVDDAVAVYRALLKEYRPEHMAIGGVSAGGGLTAASIVKARDQGLPLPVAAVLNTPWADLSKTGDSYYTLDGVDPTLPRYDGFLAASARLYAGEYALKHPLISPVYADYQPGFPPSLLISGTRDLLLSSTVRLHQALRQAGNTADLLVYDAMWHGFASHPDMPESRLAAAQLAEFLHKHLGADDDV